jgi:hypothetical protein
MTHVRSRSTAPIMSDQGTQMRYSGIFSDPPLHIPCGKKPVYPEKRHDFR